MDDDLGLELNNSFDDRDGSPYRNRGRGRGRSGFRSSRGVGRPSFKPRTPRGFRGGGFGSRGGFTSRGGRGRGGGYDKRPTYDNESPRNGYKDGDYRNASSGVENGYRKGLSRGGFSAPKRGRLDHYGERFTYGSSNSAPKGARDYPDNPRERYEDSYGYGREPKMDKFREERFPRYKEEFRRSSPILRRMSPPRRRMSPPPRRMSPPPYARMSPPRRMSPPPYARMFPPRRMSPPPFTRMSPPRRMSPPMRFRSRSPIMKRRSRSPAGRGGRFRGSSRGLRRQWTPPPPQRRERSPSPRHFERGPPRKEFHGRERFRGAGQRGFQPSKYPAPKTGFRSRGPYNGERY